MEQDKAEVEWVELVGHVQTPTTDLTKLFGVMTKKQFGLTSVIWLAVAVVVFLIFWDGTKAGIPVTLFAAALTDGFGMLVTERVLLIKASNANQSD